MRRAKDMHRQAGFTLAELVIVIVITGIIGAMIAVFMKAPIDAYFDQARRAELTDAADTSLRRIAREVAYALPNSVRIGGTACAGSGSGTYLEFIPLIAIGRYRLEPALDGSGAPLDLTEAGSSHSFDVLGPGVDVPGGASLVIYNLGLGSNDAYGGGNRRSLTSGSGLSSLTYAGSVFPEHSPSGRFHVVTDAVSFHCNTGADGTLDRYGPYAIQASQPSPTTGGNRLAGHVTGCCFQINSLTSQRGLLTLNLTLSKDNESVSLLHQVHVDNTP